MNMVKIRMQRFGTTKRPFYRIVAAEATKKRDGSYLEIVGLYDPTKEPVLIEINPEKALKWLLNGAQPTDTVKNLFTKVGINKLFVEAKKKQ
jgi:small subunit ribosomal protein S16